MSSPKSGMAPADTTRPITSRSFLWSLAFGLGMVLVFVGERAIGAGAARVAVTATGAGLAVLVTVLRALRAGRVDARAHTVGAAGTERVLALLNVVGLVALALYFVQSDALGRFLDRPLADSSPRLASVLNALWTALVTASLLPMLMVEVSYQAMARAAVIEQARVRAALYAGLGLSFALVFSFATVYVATNRDPKWDLSYSRTAKPGESTRNIVRSLQEPLEVSLFFPPANEVREQVQDYFDLVKSESPFLQVKAYDHAVDVARAKELGITANGYVAFSRGGRTERLSVGVLLESARSQLRNLDQEVQKRLLQVARARKTLYFVGGHGERAEDNTRPDDKRATIRGLRTGLRNLNHDLADLSAGTGLAAKVPENAGALFIIGPTARLQPEEVASITTYVHGGGRLYLALDPEASLDFADLLQPFGVKFTPGTLCSDAVYAAAAQSPSDNDRSNVLTASYSSHPSVTTLSRAGTRAPLLLLRAGALEDASKERPREVSIDYAVHAHVSNWLDMNGNFKLDGPAEARKPYEIVAAVTFKKTREAKPEEEGRIIVVADSDLLADPWIGYYGNPDFVSDTVKWLLGDESIQGAVNSEVDVPILHTRQDDKLWFYSTIFLAPALVVAAGLVITRRRGGRR